MAIGGWLIVAFIFVVFMIRREFKSVIKRFFIYLLISTLLREMVFILNIVYQFKDQLQRHYIEQICPILGALNLYTATLGQIFIASTVIYLLSRVTTVPTFFQQNPHSFELGFVIFVFLFPLIICIGLLFTKIFGFNIAWCWLMNCHDDTPKNNIWLFILPYTIMYFATSIVFVVILVTIYCKISHKFKPAIHVQKQAMILAACLLINAVVGVLGFILYERTTPYPFATVLSLCHLTCPIGFLVILKYQALLAFIRQKKRKKEQSPLLPNQVNNATAPFSDRVSARSTTVSITLQNTGEFTDI